MKTPPSAWVRQLELMDSNLRVRWGNVIGQWVIDRKAVIPPGEKEFLLRRASRARWLANQPNADPKHIDTYKNVAEEVLSMQDERRIIFFATNLDQNTYNAICTSDIQRYGGYSRYADELEKQEDRRNAAKERERANEREEMNRESFDQLNFMLEKKSTKLLHGERDLRKLLHG